MLANLQGPGHRLQVLALLPLQLRDRGAEARVRPAVLHAAKNCNIRLRRRCSFWNLCLGGAHSDHRVSILHTNTPEQLRPL